METKIFWGIFVIALVAGLALGTSINTSLTGHASLGDSDGGLKYEQTGSCLDSYGTHADVCVGQRYLTEWYYGEGFCASAEYDCVAAGYTWCKDGRCQ